MAEIVLTEENFDEEVLRSPLPVLVDFYAVWCGPCRMLAPVIEEIANEKEGELKVCRLDVDEAPAIADRYGISGVPTVILFRDGKAEKTAVGYRPKDALLGLLG